MRLVKRDEGEQSRPHSKWRQGSWFSTQLLIIGGAFLNMDSQKRTVSDYQIWTHKIKLRSNCPQELFLCFLISVSLVPRIEYVVRLNKLSSFK